jgi:hypothetical protein
MRHANDRALPMAVGAATNAREIIWGVDSAETLQSIGAELSKDRQVAMGNDGVLRTRDETGYGIAFEVTKRHSFAGTAALTNAAGVPPQRINRRVDFNAPHKAFVLYVPELAKARDFYIERLGFRLSDSYATVPASCAHKAPTIITICS